MRGRLTIVALLAGAPVLNAQELRLVQYPARTDTLRSVFLGFERLLSSFTWNAALNAGATAGAWSLTADLRTRSRLIRSTINTRQDEIQDTVQLRRHLNEDWSILVRHQSAIVTGPASVDLGELSQHRLLGGFTAGLADELVLSGLAGWEWNRQQDHRDSGPALGLEARVPRAHWEDILLFGRAGWYRSSLGDRSPHDGEARFTVMRSFSVQSGDSVQIMYRNQRRDLPTRASSSSIGENRYSPGIFRRDEEIVSVRNTLWTEPIPGIRATLDGGWQSRIIDRSLRLTDPPSGDSQLPTSIRQLQFDLTGRMVWTPAVAWIGDFVAGYSRAEESHGVRDEKSSSAAFEEQIRQARRRNNQWQRTFTSAKLSLPVVDPLDVSVGASANLLRYDTPDTLNTDDRDEVLFTGFLNVLVRIAPRLVATLSIEAALNHMVYVSRFQSANNFKQRTLRLAPTVVWMGDGGLRNTVLSEVSATYTVYDFEDQVGSVQSYSFRQAQWTDSLQAPVSRFLTLEFTGTLRLFERGLLKWREFVGRPERSFVETSFWPRLVVKRWPGVAVSLGFRSFRQQRYIHRTGSRSYDGSIGSDGPTASLDMALPGGGVMMMSGWRETQRTNGRSSGVISNLSVVVSTLL